MKHRLKQMKQTNKLNRKSRGNGNGIEFLAAGPQQQSVHPWEQSQGRFDSCGSWQAASGSNTCNTFKNFKKDQMQLLTHRARDREGDSEDSDWGVFE